MNLDVITGISQPPRAGAKKIGSESGSRVLFSADTNGGALSTLLFHQIRLLEDHFDVFGRTQGLVEMDLQFRYMSSIGRSVILHAISFGFCLF